MEAENPPLTEDEAARLRLQVSPFTWLSKANQGAISILQVNDWGQCFFCGVLGLLKVEERTSWLFEVGSFYLWPQICQQGLLIRGEGLYSRIWLPCGR